MTDSQGYLDFDAAHLTGFIDRFPKQHIVVVGDVMLDSFVYGDANESRPRRRFRCFVSIAR